MKFRLILACCLLPAIITAAGAEVPKLIHYQARLADDGGQPLPGPVDAVFRLYDAPTGGDLLWEESHTDLVLSEGALSVLLGGLTPLPEDLTGSPLWLEVVIEDTLLDPRLQFVSVPFALEAQRLGGLEASDLEAAGAADSLADSLAASDGSPPNVDGMVHWDNLLGVPQGFADGEDAGGAGSVTGETIKDSTITEADVSPGSLTGQSLADGGITGDDVALESLSGSHIQDDSIWSADILDKSITANDIQDGAVGTSQLASGAVTGPKLAPNSVDTSHVNFIVGDIEAVTSGPGLSGGGTSGSVQLSVGEGPGIDVQGQSVGLAPSYISGSAYDTRFVTRTTPTFNTVSAAVSVSGAVFRPVSNDGKFTSHSNGYIYVDSDDNVGAEDRFTAPVQLPHGGTITGFSVTYWDNAGGSMDFGLWRAAQNGSSANKIAGVTSTGETAAWSTGQDNTITQASIDNIEYTYWVEADFPSTPQGANLRLLSVRVNYTITAPY